MKAIPSSLRATNQRLLLERLLRDGTATRAELADRTGMSRPTAGKILDELLSAHVVEAVASTTDDAERKLGRPGQPLRLATKTPRFALIQVGVKETQVQWAPVAGAADETPNDVFATPSTASLWMDQLRTLVSRKAPKSLWGTVVSLPGVVDEVQGRSLFSPNLRWSPPVAWLDELKNVLGKPVCVVQEIRSLALGHMQQSPEERDFLLVDCGDGVGAAAVMNGQLFAGASPVVAELGHSPVLGQKRPCGCGATGCLETLLSDRGLQASWQEANKTTRGETLKKALSQDTAPPWLVETLDATAQNIASALNLFGLRQVILTGGFSELSSGAWEHLCRGVIKGALPSRFSGVSVQLGQRKRFRGLSAAAVNRLLNLE
jgi:predicted NBD/HSP70 family sugar kinase